MDGIGRIEIVKLCSIKVQERVGFQILLNSLLCFCEVSVAARLLKMGVERSGMGAVSLKWGGGK